MLLTLMSCMQLWPVFFILQNLYFPLPNSPSNPITSFSSCFSSIPNFRLTPIPIVSFISTTTLVDTEDTTFLFGRLSSVYIRSWTLVDKIYQPLCGMVTDIMTDTCPGSAATTQGWTSEWSTSIPTPLPNSGMVTGTIKINPVGVQSATHTWNWNSKRSTGIQIDLPPLCDMVAGAIRRSPVGIQSATYT